MSNPYMRSALMDEMEEGVKRPGPGTRASGAPTSRAYTPGRAVEAQAAGPAPLSAEYGSQYEVPEPGGGGVDPLEPGTGGAGPPPPTYANPWDDPASSQYAPRIVQRNGQTYLTEHGNERLLQPGQEVTDATKYRDDFWNQYQTGFQPGVGPQTNEEYAPPTQQASAASLGASGATAGRYAGFDTQRAQDPTTSAKDAFLQAATASGSMPSTKDEAEAWFNQYVKQALIDAGYQVDWVEGDKAFVRTRENPQGEEIDFLQDAGGANPMLAWQSNMAGQTTAGGGAGSDTSGQQGFDNFLLGDDSATDDVDAAIQKLLESGMSFDEILAMLQAQGVGQ